MSGRHEPPTNRSFYLSVATSTLRLLITAALVLGGIALIDQAFPSRVVAPDNGTAEPSVSVSVSPTESASPSPAEEPDLLGIHVGVFNGTDVTGLASDTAASLQDDYGMIPDQIEDAPSDVNQTTIFYADAELELYAQTLASKYFKRLDVRIAPLEAGTQVQNSVDLAIYLGTDYAALQG